MNGPDCIEAQECRGDFWVMLQEAVAQAGGCPAIVLGGVAALGPFPARPALADTPLREVVELLAQNGIRMVYLPGKHISALSL